jgi:GPI-anchor transamidase subunit U
MKLIMPIDRRKAAVVATAVVLRVVVFVIFPGLPDLLTGQVEVSTPVSSFKRCKKQWDISWTSHIASS